jgi:hypothetical protein
MPPVAAANGVTSQTPISGFDGFRVAPEMSVVIPDNSVPGPIRFAPDLLR